MTLDRNTQRTSAEQTHKHLWGDEAVWIYVCVRLAASTGFGRRFGAHGGSCTSVSFAWLRLWCSRLLCRCVSCRGHGGALLLGGALRSRDRDLWRGGRSCRGNDLLLRLLLLEEFLMDNLCSRSGACGNYLHLSLRWCSSCGGRLGQSHRLTQTYTEEIINIASVNQ